MKLYDLELSGNCYKVRLFAALAGIPLQRVAVDFLGGEHKRPPLLDLNPWGELPILEADDLVLRDAQAILVYLAGRFAARLVDKFGYALDKAAALARGERILALLERHLAARDWLAAGRPTIAECAVYPYVALAEEGGLALAPYPAIRAWMRRIRALPGFLAMSGIHLD